MHEAGLRYLLFLNGSPLTSIAQWVEKILVPYLNRVKAKKGLTAMQALLLIDCWSVHRGSEFRDWMKKKYNWISIVFVPGGCTGKVQPNDVGVQRILKHIIRSEAVEQFTRDCQEQLTVQPNKPVQIAVDIKTLRNKSVS